MQLNVLYQELNAILRQNQLQISSELYEGTFNGVLASLYESTILISTCTLNLYEDYIEIKGKTTIALIYNGSPIDLQILCYQKENYVWCQLKISANTQCKIEDFFFMLSGSRIANGSVYSNSESVLKGIVLNYPELVTNSDRIYQEYPFDIQSGIAFSGNNWNRYTLLTVGASNVTGKVSLKDTFSFYSNSKFKLKVPLIAKSNFDRFKNATLLIQLYSGMDNIFDTQFMQKLSGADLVFHLEMKKVSTPMDFSMALFDIDTMWQIVAGFEKGLGLSDAFNTILELLHVDNLYLPSNTPLDFMKLYFLGVRYNAADLKKSYCEGVKLIAASSEQWVLPIPWIRLQDFSLAFETSVSQSGASIYSTDVAGTVCFKLGETKLSMSASAVLPNMEFSGSLVWDESDWGNPSKPVTLTDLLSPFKASAPNADAGSSLIGRIDVAAAYNSREFSISADIRNILQFSIGNFKINLAQILVEGSLSPTTQNASIYGVMAFGDSIDPKYFELDAKASYKTGEWDFEGGLKLGVVNIGDVLTKIFKLDSSSIIGDIFNIELNALRVRFNGKGDQYSILAGFHGDWTLIGQQISTDARLQLQKTSQKETLFAAAIFEVNVGIFSVVVQANDFYSKTASYLFRIQYDQLFLQAVYAVKQIDQKAKEILTVSMGGMTLGALVESLVSMLNPNMHYKLEAPWNVLNKIDLSKFQLVINTTDQVAGFYYSVNLNILGLMQIDKIGLEYRTETGKVEGSSVSDKKIFFALTGKLLDQKYTEDDPLTWDAVDGKPPEASALNQKTFTLYYLGLGQHLKNDQAKAATTLLESLSALKEQLKPSADGNSIPSEIQYDGDMNWLLGAEFKVDALKVGLVLNDPIMYGLMITVAANTGALAAFSGLYLELFYKKITEDISMFKAVLMLPEKFRTIQLGVVSVKIGLVSFEVYTNGSFYIDLGFPHNADFSNSFVLEVYIFTGRGGIYLGTLKGVPSKSVPQVTNGAFSTVIMLGVGLSFGLGRSFDFGIVKGGLSLEVFGIFEGTLAFFDCKDDNKQYLYYSASATVGIFGRLFLSVDFKVITISASAEIKAYAALTLEAYKAMNLALDLNMSLKASVKVLFIKVKFSYTFNKHVEFNMGSDSIPPWKIANAQQEIAKQCMQALLKDSRRPLFTSEPLTAGVRKTIQLSLLPFFSIENPVIQMAPLTIASVQSTNPSHCVAFLPIMDVENQKNYIGLLSEWLLTRWDGDQILYDPAFVPDLASELTYETLNTFLQNNAFISLDLSSKSDIDGAAFPIMPPLTLSWNPDGTPDDQKAMTHFWQDSLVNADYAELLTAYFEALNPDPMYEPLTSALNTLADGDQIPLAELIFLDYFQMTLRELIGQIAGFFTQFNCPIGNKTYDAIEWTKILEDNLNLAFTPGTFNFPSLNYRIIQGETLDQIATKLGLSYQTLLEGCKAQTMILRQGAPLSLTSYVFNNQTKQIPLKLVAALFYVRYFEFDMENGYQEYSKSLAELNPEFPLNDEIVSLDTPIISLPIQLAGINMSWQPLMGDTFVRLCKMCAYYELEAGENLQWDQFLNAITQINDAVTIPVAITSVNGDLTLEMLIRRIYPDQEMVSWTEGLLNAIFAADLLSTFVNLSLVQVPCVVQAQTEGSGEMAKDIMNRMGATAKDLGAALSVDSTRVDCTQAILFANQLILSKQDVLDQLLAVEVNSIPELLSRFLLQGLRIPNPWPEGKLGGALQSNQLDDVETLPLFEAMKQQVSFIYDIQSWNLSCYGGQSDCSWLDTTVRTRTFTSAEIGNELPATQISMGITPPQKIPDFMETMPCYPVTTQLPWQIANISEALTVNLLPSALCANLASISLEPVGKTSKGNDVTTKWGTYIQVQVSKGEIDSNTFNVLGANAQDRLLLRALLDSETESIHLLYKPSQTTGIEESLVEECWDKTQCVLMKSNLSIETHMSPMQIKAMLNSDAGGEDSYLYSANLDPANQKTFLRLLWECSVVGGGGYQLVLKNTSSISLPENIFDDNQSAILYLLVVQSGYPVNRVPINCTMTQNAQMQGETITYYEQFDEMRKEYQVSFPVGCLGIRLEMQAPPEPEAINLTPEDRTKQIFHIVGYQIEENASFKGSHESVPLVPQADPASTIWHYEPVVPLYKYVEAGDPYIYAANGKQADIAFDLRDILGNRAQIQDFAIDIIPEYNDFLIALHEWPYQTVYYEIIGDPQNPMLRITCEPKENETINAASLVQLKYAFAQLMQLDIQVTVTSSFLGDSEPEMDLLTLRTYLLKLIQYAETQTAKPDPLIAEFGLMSKDANAISLPNQIFQLFAKVTITRTDFISDVLRAKQATSNIAPLKDDSDTFVNQLETAIPNIRVAQGDGNNNSLYGILFGENGAVKQIQISPYAYTADSKTICTPAFYALRPLKNQWMTRNCVVFDLDSAGRLDMENGVPINKVYSNIDMEIWANTFLDDVEETLLLAAKWIATEDCKKTFDAFVEGKKKLAEVITNQLVPLRKGSVADASELKKQLQDKLMRSLSEGYQIDLMAQYQLQVKTNQSCRMTVSAETEETDATLQTGKIVVNNDANTYCMFVTAKSDWQAGLSPKIQASIQEIEYDIEDVEGNYQSSKWLRLFNPIKDRDLNGINLTLSSDMPFPNVLKRCPLPPAIPSHSCTTNDVHNISDMLRWEYSVVCDYEPYEQDALYLNVAFGCRTALKQVIENKDLFDVLAQYDHVREMLFANLNSQQEDRFNQAFKSFLELLQDAGTTWEAWLNVERLSMSQQLQERVYQCKITMQKQQGVPQFQLTSLNDTEKILQDLGASDAQVNCLNVTESMLEIQVAIDHLPLYDCHTAAPSIQVVRNADVLGNWQMNEQFIYRTEIVSKSAVEAVYVNYNEFRIGQMQLSTLSDYQNMLQSLWNTLQLNGVNLTMKMSISYVYSLIQGQQLPVVRIPVTLYLNILADGSRIPDIAQNLFNWFTQQNPCTNSAYYQFDVTIYAEDDQRVLLQLPQVVYGFTE